MTLEEFFIAGTPAFIGLLGVAWTNWRNQRMAMDARRAELDSRRISIAASLYSELLSAKIDMIGQEMALAAKSNRYITRAQDYEQANKKSPTTLVQYVPNIDRTVYSSCSGDFGLLGPEVSAAVVVAYNRIEMVRRCFEQRPKSTNKEVGEAVGYLRGLLNLANESVDNAVQELAKLLPRQVTGLELFDCHER